MALLFALTVKHLSVLRFPFLCFPLKGNRNGYGMPESGILLFCSKYEKSRYQFTLHMHPQKPKNLEK